jgi:hypothetical protein
MTIPSGPRVHLTITFRTPSRQGGPRADVHERALEAVPRAAAEQMADDFQTYQARGGAAEKNKLYRFERAGEEVLVPLDFGEVLSLTATTP